MREGSPGAPHAHSAHLGQMLPGSDPRPHPSAPTALPPPCPRLAAHRHAPGAKAAGSSPLAASVLMDLNPTAAAGSAVPAGLGPGVARARVGAANEAAPAAEAVGDSPAVLLAFWDRGAQQSTAVHSSVRAAQVVVGHHAAQHAQQDAGRRQPPSPPATRRGGAPGRHRPPSMGGSCPDHLAGIREHGKDDHGCGRPCGAGGGDGRAEQVLAGGGRGALHMEAHHLDRRAGLVPCSVRHQGGQGEAPVSGGDAAGNAG